MALGMIVTIGGIALAARSPATVSWDWSLEPKVGGTGWAAYWRWAAQ